jgi:hypothetical protein
MMMKVEWFMLSVASSGIAMGIKLLSLDDREEAWVPLFGILSFAIFLPLLIFVTIAIAIRLSGRAAERRRDAWLLAQKLQPPPPRPTDPGSSSSPRGVPRGV